MNDEYGWTKERARMRRIIEEFNKIEAMGDEFDEMKARAEKAEAMLDKVLRNNPILEEAASRLKFYQENYDTLQAELSTLRSKLANAITGLMSAGGGFGTGAEMEDRVNRLAADVIQQATEDSTLEARDAALAKERNQ